MSLWKKADQANAVPIFIPARSNKTPNTANRDATYANTTANATMAQGTFLVSTGRLANTSGGGEGKAVNHTGWNLRKNGTGPIVSFSVTAGGTGYSNTDVVKVAAPSAGANATGTVVTNGSGVIQSVAVNAQGSGFLLKNPSVTIANSTGGASAGSGATIVATAGGRAGRVQYETLVTFTNPTTANNNLP